MYQLTRLYDASALGVPGPLPDVIATWGTAPDLLADLTGRVDPQFGFDGTGYWPVTVATPSFDATERTLSGTITLGAADAKARTWAATADLRDLTAAESAVGLAAAQGAAGAAVDARRDGILAGGWAHDFGGPIGVKTLQTRPSDTANWLTVQGSCLAAVAAGQGAAQGITLRTGDNTNVPLTYADALKVMLALAAWGSAVYAASWSLKDRISAAPDQASVAAIDVTAGWPAATG